MRLYDTRDEYFNEDLISADENPFDIFRKWYAEAEKSEPHSPNAMVLSTVDALGTPSSRAVLLKALEGGAFVFFTNMTSPKSMDIRGNAKVCLHFYWKSMHRQVKVVGHAQEVGRLEAARYFLTRPLESQISSWVSVQSTPVVSRQSLLEKLKNFRQNLPSPMVAPAHWGGYRVIPFLIEFWQGAEHRLHHRVEFRRNADSQNAQVAHEQEAEAGFTGTLLNP